MNFEPSPERFRIADFGLRILRIVDLGLKIQTWDIQFAIAITFRNSSARKERFAPGGKVYIRASVPFHDRHYNEMESTLDRNDNQGTCAFLALVHGKDHSSGPGIAATAEMLFQARTQLLSERRYVD